MGQNNARQARGRGCRGLFLQTITVLPVLALLFGTTLSAEPIPAKLIGTWRITKILPTTNTGCWTTERARPLVGTTLTYEAHAMRWQGGEVPVLEVITRSLDTARFRRENPGSKGGATLAQVGISAASVTELDLQHDDADITGASTEVPGDSVLLASPTRIVVSACGVYMEAVRAGAPAVAKGKPRGRK